MSSSIYTVPAQVFGPNRPAAARAAIQELLQAGEAYIAAGGAWGPERHWNRLQVAKSNRSQYSEYGSTWS